MYVTIATDAIPRLDITPSEAPQRRTWNTRLKSGDHLYFEGDDVRRIYRVRSGVLRLSRLLEDGRRQVIAFGYPGDIVGFPSNGRHHTDCDALTSAKLNSYHYDGLGQHSEPALHRELLKAALDEISAMQDHFMMLGRKSAVEKLCSFLTVLSGRVGKPHGPLTRIDLPMSRTDIADFLGLTTETISRTFTHLRKKKAISLEDAQTVIVLDPDALTAMAKGNDA